MKSVLTFLFASLLFVSCNKDENLNAELQAVVDAVWGKTLTQVGVPDAPFVATIDDETTFLANTGETHSFKVETKETVTANDSYPGNRALFTGEGYSLYATILNNPTGQIRLKAIKDGMTLMEGNFE